jgi:hypothetical protein
MKTKFVILSGVLEFLLSCLVVNDLYAPTVMVRLARQWEQGKNSTKCIA